LQNVQQSLEQQLSKNKEEALNNSEKQRKEYDHKMQELLTTISGESKQNLQSAQDLENKLLQEQDKVKQLESEKKAMETSQKTLESSLAELQQIMSHTEAELKSSNSAITAAQEEKNKLKSEIQKLQIEKGQSESRHEEYQALKLNELKQQYDKEKNFLVEDVQSKEKDILEMKEIGKSRDEKLKSLENQVKDSKVELFNLKEQLELELSNFKADIAKQKESTEKSAVLQSQIEKYQAEKQKAIQDIEQLMNQLKQENEANLKLAKQLNEEEDYIKNLQNSRSDMLIQHKLELDKLHQELDRSGAALKQEQQLRMEKIKENDTESVQLQEATYKKRISQLENKIKEIEIDKNISVEPAKSERPGKAITLSFLSGGLVGLATVLLWLQLVKHFRVPGHFT